MKAILIVLFVFFSLLLTGGLFTLWFYNLDRSIAAAVVIIALWLVAMVIIWLFWYAIRNDPPEI